MQRRKKQPPVLAKWLLQTFVRYDNTEATLGDFEELFYEKLRENGRLGANIWYYGQAVISLPNVIQGSIYWSLSMFKNYLKIAFRNLLKHKTFSLINIAGLAIGIACCLLILIYVQTELSYDKFHTKADNIYRVAGWVKWNGGSENAASTQFQVAGAMLTDYPEIMTACRLFRPGVAQALRYGDKKFVEENVLNTDASIFDIFDFSFIAGDPHSALQDPQSIVITETIAKKYFGDGPALGQTINYQNMVDLRVTGVIQDVPATSHLQFEILIPFGFNATFLAGLERNWYWNAFWTYLVLPDEQTAVELETRFPAFVQKYFPESFREGTVLYLQKLPDIHLHSHLVNEIAPNGNILYIYIFSAIAFLILTIACINFMNLATARAASRAREVGMRKVLGAARGNLIRQFYLEATVMTLFAVVLAIIIADLALPLFNSLTGQHLELDYLANWKLLGAMLLLALIVGLIAGSYPAFFLSSFEPSRVLRGSLSGLASSVILRKVLVTTQFIISIVLLIGIGVISQQVNFFRTKALGFDKEHVVIIRSRPEVDRQFEAFRNQLLQTGGVTQVTRAIGSLPTEPSWTFRFVPEGWPVEKPIAMAIAYADYDFLKLFNIELSRGRDFSREFSTDVTEAIILNETAAEKLGWQAEEAIGKQLDYFGAGSNEFEKQGKVIGLVRDFHFESLHNEVRPLAITLIHNQLADVAVKIKGSDIAETMTALENVWHRFAPQWPIEYKFLDQDLDKQYRKEMQLGRIIRTFAILAVFVACLGLFGLSSFVAQRKTKEIGVRKVLGASVSSILLHLSKEFSQLVLFAFMIAAPIAYLTMNLWLQDFAYRIALTPGIFVMAGLVTLAVALTTVAYQVTRAALINPVNALRHE